MVSSAKENILKKIRQALSISTPIPFPETDSSQQVFESRRQDLEVEFAERFNSLLGRFVFCVNNDEMIAKLNQLIAHNKWTKIFCCETALASLLQGDLAVQCNHQDLETCDASITSCELLVARTGSIVLSSMQESGRTASVYAPVHICIAYTNQLVYDAKDALERMKDAHGDHFPSFLSMATGPSRTADIEKTLVVGVHGPKEVYVFLIQSL